MASRFIRVGRYTVALLVAALPVAFGAQLPAEVTGLKWCPGTKNCLQWDGAANASSYVLYRGDRTTLPTLLTPVADSCALRGYPVPTTDPALGANPPAGGLHWFLVAAVNLNGEGPAGVATVGPEIANDTRQCNAVCSSCPTGCDKSLPYALRGPLCMEGLGCGCHDDGDCVSNRCVEVGALTLFGACPAPHP